MLFIYSILVHLSVLLIRVASLFNDKAKLWVSGRKDLFQKLSDAKIPKGVIWFHTASLGEYEQAKPVISRIKQTHPNKKILVTFFSPSGYEIRKNDSLPDYIFYLPSDTVKNAKKFISIVNPSIAIFVRYEFWPNFYTQIQKNNIRMAIISAHFRSDQFIFSKLGGFIKSILLKVDLMVVQYESSKNELLKNGFDSSKIHVCGDSRIDRVNEIAQKPILDPALDAFTKDSKVLVLGSCYQDEISFISNVLIQNPSLKLILAPHYVDDKTVASFQEMLPVKSVRYTDISSNDKIEERVLFLNTMGMLSGIYHYGDFALIGGGFKDGIHSILEPAAFGLPLMFGPHHKPFPEAQSLIDLEGAFEVKDQKSFENVFLPLLNDDNFRDKTSNSVKSFIEQHQGAANCIEKKLSKFL